MHLNEILAATRKRFKTALKRESPVPAISKRVPRGNRLRRAGRNPSHWGRRLGAVSSGLVLVAQVTQFQPMCDVMIETVDVHRSYRIGKKSIEVLHGIDLRIQRGERVFLCGPSGAGKTTLLYTLAGLERPERGSVHIHGADLYAMGRREQARFRNREIGYVFQNYHLLPELTALENVAVPGAIAGRDSSVAALHALARVGLSERTEHLPAELSGGEQQRVAIARAIVNEPKVLFADEPTGNLDSKNSAEIMAILLDLATEHQVTLVVVTHDQNLAQAGDRTLIIRDGSIHPSARP
jgi:ABC-type lipoprotein export system ATPase subunit